MGTKRTSMGTKRTRVFGVNKRRTRGSWFGLRRTISHRLLDQTSPPISKLGRHGHVRGDNLLEESRDFGNLDFVFADLDFGLVLFPRNFFRTLCDHVSKGRDRGIVESNENAFERQFGGDADSRTLWNDLA